MKLLIDAQLPPALARALKEIGEDAYPVRELGLRDADDTTIWDYAIENKMVLITKDEDFSERFLVSKKHLKLFGFESETPQIEHLLNGLFHCGLKF